MSGRTGSDDLPRSDLNNGSGKPRMLDVFILISDPKSDKLVQRTFQVDARFADQMNTPQKAVREMNFLNRLARATWAAYYEMTSWLNEGKLPQELALLHKANRAQSGLNNTRIESDEPEVDAAGFCPKHPGTPFKLLKAGVHKITGNQRWQKVCVRCRAESQHRYYQRTKAAKEDKVS